MKLDFACLMFMFSIYLESFKYQMVTQNLYVVYQDGTIEEYGENFVIQNISPFINFD